MPYRRPGELNRGRRLTVFSRVRALRGPLARDPPQQGCRTGAAPHARSPRRHCDRAASRRLPPPQPDPQDPGEPAEHRLRQPTRLGRGEAEHPQQQTDDAADAGSRAGGELHQGCGRQRLAPLQAARNHGHSLLGDACDHAQRVVGTLRLAVVAIATNEDARAQRLRLGAGGRRGFEGLHAAHLPRISRDEADQRRRSGLVVRPRTALEDGASANGGGPPWCRHRTGATMASRWATPLTDSPSRRGRNGPPRPGVLATAEVRWWQGPLGLTLRGVPPASPPDRRGPPRGLQGLPDRHRGWSRAPRRRSSSPADRTAQLVAAQGIQRLTASPLSKAPRAGDPL